jgi:hypothetical protein
MLIWSSFVIRGLTEAIAFSDVGDDVGEEYVSSFGLTIDATTAPALMQENLETETS